MMESIFSQHQVSEQYARDLLKKGRKEGLKEGRKESQIEIASKLLKEGFPEDAIARVTSLPVEKVREIRGM